MYVGTGLSGRTTSLVSVLRAVGQTIEPAQVRATVPITSRPVEHHFQLAVGERTYAVAASVSWVRPWLWYDDPTDATMDPRIIAEIDLLPMCDGFVFVVDSNPERTDASLEAWERLAADLASRGSDLADFPVVFQANMRDIPGACSMEWVRRTFHVRRCGYVESLAKHGIGTVEAMRELLLLLDTTTNGWKKSEASI